MLGWLVKRKIAAFEKDFDYDMEYARRHLFRERECVLEVFQTAGAFRASPRRAMRGVVRGEDRCHAGRGLRPMGAARGYDGGTSRPESRNASNDCANNEAAMPEDAALGWRFARSVLARDISESDRLHQKIIDRWGQRALVSLALTIAARLPGREIRAGSRKSLFFHPSRRFRHAHANGDRRDKVGTLIVRSVRTVVFVF